MNTTQPERAKTKKNTLAIWQAGTPPRDAPPTDPPSCVPPIGTSPSSVCCCCDIVSPRPTDFLTTRETTHTHTPRRAHRSAMVRGWPVANKIFHTSYLYYKYINSRALQATARTSYHTSIVPVSIILYSSTVDCITIPQKVLQTKFPPATTLSPGRHCTDS